MEIQYLDKMISLMFGHKDSIHYFLVGVILDYRSASNTKTASTEDFHKTVFPRIHCPPHATVVLSVFFPPRMIIDWLWTNEINRMKITIQGNELNIRHHHNKATLGLTNSLLSNL